MDLQPIHIALVDDHSLFRSGIANLLSEFKDLHISFEASNGRELQQLLPSHSTIDVILMDINMPGLDGYATTAWVKEFYPRIRVLALSMFDDDSAIIKMIRAGAGGYILKESQPTELYRAISEIKERGYYTNELVSGRLIRSFQQKDRMVKMDGPAESMFTPKELEFLQLCASELTYREIAAQMNISHRTVDNYREAIFEKIDVKTRVGIVIFGIRNQLIKI